VRALTKPGITPARRCWPIQVPETLAPRRLTAQDSGKEASTKSQLWRAVSRAQMGSQRTISFASLALLLGACFSDGFQPSNVDGGADSDWVPDAAAPADAAVPTDAVPTDAADEPMVDEADAMDDGDGDEPVVGGCVAETDRELCARQNKTCGTFSSNDNCGDWRTIDDCGFGVACEAPLICGSCNRCCLKETDVEFCARMGATCGAVSAPDNCGGWRTVAACGTCAVPKVCDRSNVCCTPEADGGVSCPLPPSDGGLDGD
jgi:hypothetical protein